MAETRQSAVEREQRRSGTDWGTYGRRPVRLLAGVALIDAIDRGILPGVLSLVQDDFGFNDTRAGFLGTAFVITGFIVTIPAGYLADRYRRVRIISAVLLSWGAISALNAAVRNYWQFLAVRAALGIGETVDNPASSSLIADYYRPQVRSRAYAFIRVAPLAGSAIGLALGGFVGARLGWRWAFLLVGVPGSLLAVAMWRLPEPRRGESDEEVVDEAAISVPPTPPAPPREGGARTAFADIRRALTVPSLRALMVGSAISSGALAGLGFWAPSFYERHAGLSAESSAALAGGLILLGAIAGTVIGGRIADRLRQTDPGAPMLVAGVSQAVGALLLMPTFLPVPLWFRMPVQVLAVACILGGLPGLSTMISEVVRPTLRGIAFSLTAFFGACVGAGSPALVGFLADQFAVTVDGELEGHLANAFLCVTPLVFVAALVVLNGRRHVERDIDAAQADH
ncbi:MAG: MFS transporter [Acidimicrobiales bacterium]|nr:MFS transporter [Acidimicrobiales bacterium]